MAEATPRVLQETMSGNGFDTPALAIPAAAPGQGHSLVLTPPSYPVPGGGVHAQAGLTPSRLSTSSLPSSTQGSPGGQQTGHVPWAPASHSNAAMPSPGVEVRAPILPPSASSTAVGAVAVGAYPLRSGTEAGYQSAQTASGVSSAGLLAAAQAAASVSLSPNPAASRPLAAFLKCLYDLINEPGNGAWVHWSADGASFVIADVEGFAANVLPKYYRHSNFSSFSRQLNFYSFKKVMEEGGEGATGVGGVPAGAAATAGSNAVSQGQHGSGGSSVAGAGFTGILGLPSSTGPDPFNPSTRVPLATGVGGAANGSKIGNNRTPNVLEYKHRYFLRGRPDLLHRVVRKTNATAIKELAAEEKQDKLRRRREQQLLAVLGLAPPPAATGTGNSGKDRAQGGADGSGASDGGSSFGAGTSGSGSGMPPPPPGSSHVTSALTAAGVDPVTAALVASTLGLGNLSTETLAAVAAASATGGRLQQPSGAGATGMLSNGGTTSVSAAPIHGLSLRASEGDDAMWGMPDKHSMFMDHHSSEMLSPRQVSALQGRGGGGRAGYGATLAQRSCESGRHSIYSRGSGMGLAGGSSRWQYGGLDRLPSPSGDRPYIDLGLGGMGLLSASSMEQGGGMGDYSHGLRGVAGGSPLVAAGSDVFPFTQCGQEHTHAGHNLSQHRHGGGGAPSPTGSDSDNPLVPAPVLVYVPPLPAVQSYGRNSVGAAASAEPGTLPQQRSALTVAAQQAAVNMSGGTMLECASTSTAQAASVMMNSLAAFGTAISSAATAIAPIPPSSAPAAGNQAVVKDGGACALSKLPHTSASAPTAEDVLRALNTGTLSVHAAVQAFRAGIIGSPVLIEALKVCAAKDAQLATQVVSTLPPPLQVAFVLHLGQQQARTQAAGAAAAAATSGITSALAPSGPTAASLPSSPVPAPTALAHVQRSVAHPGTVQHGSGLRLQHATSSHPHTHAPAQHRRTWLSGDLVLGLQQRGAPPYPAPVPAPVPVDLSHASGEGGLGPSHIAAYVHAPVHLGGDSRMLPDYSGAHPPAPLHTPFPHSPAASMSPSHPLSMGGPGDVDMLHTDGVSPLAALLKGGAGQAAWGSSMQGGGTASLPSLHGHSMRHSRHVPQEDGSGKGHRSGHFLRERGSGVSRPATRHSPGRPLMQETVHKGPAPLADHEFDMSALQDMGQGSGVGPGSIGMHQQATIQQSMAALGLGLQPKPLAPQKPKTRSSPAPASLPLPLKPSIVGVTPPPSGPPGGSEAGGPASPAMQAPDYPPVDGVSKGRAQAPLLLSSEHSLPVMSQQSPLLSNGAAAAPASSPSASHSTASGGPRVGMPPRLQLKAIAMQAMQGRSHAANEANNASATAAMRAGVQQAYVQQHQGTMEGQVEVGSSHNKRRRME